MREVDEEMLMALNKLPDYIEYINSTKELDPEFSEVNAARIYLMMNSPFAMVEPEGDGE